MTTKAESKYMSRVAGLGCLICEQPALVHHIRDGQGMSQRASNWLTIPLCPDHHVGVLSIHMSKRQFENIYGSEMDLLAETIKKLNL
jgi:hypothetical protein